MAITYLGSSTSSSTNGGDVTINLSSISGLAEGDLVIVVGACGDNDNVDFTEAMVTSGYTTVADLFANDTQDTTMGVFWKIMGATPDSSAVYSGQGGTDSAVAAIAFGFRGVHQTTPMDVTPTTATGTDSNIVNPPSIDHNNPSGVWTVALGAFGHTSGNAVTCTVSSGYSGSTSVSGNDTSDITVCGGYLSSPSDPEDPGVFTPSIGDSTSHSWCACTIALRPAPTATNINCTVQSLTLTESAATVNAAKNISAGVDALTLATYASGIGLNKSISANVASLTLTEYPASLNAATNISASFDSLAIASYSANVGLNKTISANVHALTLTTYQATVDFGAGTGLDTARKRGSAIHVGLPFRDIYPFPDGTLDQGDRQFVANLYADISALSATNINAGYAALTLTEYAATVNAAKSISANVDTLTLTAYQAGVALNINVSATVQALTLTEYPAGINAATSIQANTDALSVTTYTATVTAGGVVFATVVNMALTTYPATVDYAGAVAGTSRVAGGTPARRKRVIIDGRRYDVDDKQELQLLKSWIDSLEEEKHDKQKELVKARKLVKKAKAYKAQPEQARKTAPQPKAPSIAPLIRSIERIEEKRMEAMKRYKAIMAEIEDEEDSMALILTMGM